VIVVALPEVHRRNKTAITIRRILHNALKLLIKRILRHRRTTHVSPRRGVDELPQTGRGRRRILRLRVPAGLPRNNVIETLPPGTALTRPPLSLSPRLTAFPPDTSRYNVFNVARRALNEVGNHAGLRLNPLDRCLNHFLSTRTNELSETAIPDTLFDFVEQFFKRVQEREDTRATTTGSVRRFTNIGTITSINMKVVVVSRCPPNRANAGELAFELANPLIEERHFRSVLTARTVVKVNSPVLVMQRVTGVPRTHRAAKRWVT